LPMATKHASGWEGPRLVSLQKAPILDSCGGGYLGLIIQESQRRVRRLEGKGTKIHRSRKLSSGHSRAQLRAAQPGGWRFHTPHAPLLTKGDPRGHELQALSGLFMSKTRRGLASSPGHL
jgi:hypothetical protein